VDERRRPSARSKAGREFVSEAEEILERMRDALARLAEATDQGREPDPDLVNGLFRSAHSLKGLSGMFGLGSLSDLAHHLEDVLDRLRLGRAQLDAAALALFDESITLIVTTLEKIDDQEARPATEEAIADLVGRIDAWTEPPARDAGAAPELALAPALLRALTEYEEHRLRENMRRGRAICLVEADFEILSFEEGLAELSSAIREAGELLSTLPSPGEAPDSQIRFSLLVATSLGLPDLTARIGVPSERVRVTWQPPRDVAPSVPAAAAAPTAPAPEARAAPVSAASKIAVPIAADAVALGTGAEAPSLKSISDTVRVDIRKLDELMNLVGELVAQRTSVQRVAQRLSGQAATARLGAELEKIHRGLERKLKELQTAVLEVRMVPLRQVFDKLSRVVRRLRVDLHKEVRLEIRGADTELDKLIVEELVDPLMHVVRNAFDHAIEPPEERVAAGKPREGVIRLEAYQRGHDVVIAVADDGRGIDTEAVLECARERGLITHDAELTKKETMGLLFAAGVSTRREVTETSGRGVGMDVVRANIAALGGVVDVDSERGRGTTIIMTLPITLAMIQALLVGVGTERFAIPLNSVRETLVVDASEIHRSAGREMLSLRGEPLLLHRLAEGFGLGAADRAAKQYAVVLAVGETRLGLLVDRLEGQQDTVIKPIQGPVRQVRGIAGATELGEQGAVLVLDVSALVEEAMRGRQAA
jgi:two-component system, chemotaxis family, sensor kinase CheA